MSVTIKLQLNPFSNSKKVFKSEAVSINEIIAKIDTKKAVNTGWRVLINDEIITDYERKPADGDTVYIKVVPEGDDTKGAAIGEKVGGGILAAAGIAVGLLTSWTGIGAFLGASLVGAGVSLLASGIVAYNTSPKSSREKVEQSPAIRGSRNQARPLETLPILLGKRRIYADLAATPYTMIGDDGAQYLYQLFCVAQKDLTIDQNSFQIGDTKIIEYSATKDINSILSGKDQLVELKVVSGGNVPPFYDSCVHEEIINEPLKNLTEEKLPGEIIRTTPDNTQEINIDIFFPSGLGVYNKDGDLESASVKVCAYYKLETAPDSGYELMGYFANNTNVISGDELKTMRFSVGKNNLAPGKYTVKIIRESEDHDDSQYVDSVYLGSIRSLKHEQAVSAERCSQLTLIGLKVKASSKLHSYIETLNFTAQSKLPVHTIGSGAQSWTGIAESSNPASCAIYAMQGDLCQQKLSDNDIDWPAFEKLYSWCAEKGYECNELVYDNISISELLSSIASTCRAEILRINGKITVIQDIERSGFVQAFTPRNSWDYQEKIIKASLPDALSLEFSDSASGYAEQELKIYNTPTGNKDKDPEVIQEVTLWGVTSNVQARKLGMYKIAVSKNRPFVYQFSSDFEYMLCSKGDWIKYAGDVALAGITQGRVSELIYSQGAVVGFVSDEVLPMEAGKEYAVRVRKQDCTFKILRVINNNTQSKNVYFVGGLSEEVNEGDLFLFGYPEMDSIDLIITDIQCNDDRTALITAVDYSPEIYGVDDPDFVLPEFKNKITESVSKTDGSITLDLSDWQYYVTYNDSKTVPETPTGNGNGDGWHTLYTPEARWQSHKTAKNIYDGVWSAPSRDVQSQIKNLWANHVVTLYRELQEGEASLIETGITSDLIYNFGQNTIAWLDALKSNHWKLEFPKNPKRTVFVTSATAYGKEDTDIINYNEWAQPVPVGQNGVNGISIAQLSLYKRSLTKPNKPYSDSIYCFNDGSLKINGINWDDSSDNGEWYRNIPPLDEASNPIWECHVTALTTEGYQEGTNLLDSIPYSEWSSPEQYSENQSLSKAEIEKLISDAVTEGSTPYIYAEPSVIGFAVNESSYVPVNQVIKTKINVWQFGKEVDFILGDLSQIIPPEFSYVWDGENHELTITAVQAKRVLNQTWLIPISFTALKAYYGYKVTGTDDTRYVNQHYELMLSKPDDWETNYGDYFKANGKTPVKNTSSTWATGTYYRLVTQKYGYYQYEETPTNKMVEISVVTIKGGNYLGPVTSISDLNSKMTAWLRDGIVINDYFTWTGDDSASSSVIGGQFKQFCTYSYTGQAVSWKQETDTNHIAMTLSDILDKADDELKLAEKNPAVYNYAKKLYASKFVGKQIIANEGFIDQLFTHKVTISRGGSLVALDTNGLESLKIDGADGTLTAKKAIIEGEITATKLTLGAGVTIATSNVSGLDSALNSKVNSSELDADLAVTIKEQQKIYKISSSTPTAPSSYVGSTAVDGWTRTKPTISADDEKNKRNIYSCVQYKKYNDTTISNTAVGIDADTVITNGMLRTALIDVDTLLTKQLTLKNVGCLQSSNFDIATASGFRLYDSGYAVINNVTIPRDVELPAISLFQSTIDVRVDLSSLSASELKQKFDSLINSYGVKAVNSNTDDWYVYCNITSYDPTYYLVNYVNGANDKICHYLCKYKSTDGVTHYVIGNTEEKFRNMQYQLVSVERELITVSSSGSITKNTAGGSTKLFFSAKNNMTESYSTAYARGYIIGKCGHRVKRHAVSSWTELRNLLNNILDQNQGAFYFSSNDLITACIKVFNVDSRNSVLIGKEGSDPVIYTSDGKLIVSANLTTPFVYEYIWF